MSWYFPCDHGAHRRAPHMLPKQTAWEWVLQHRAQLSAHQRKHRWAAWQGGPKHPQQCPRQPCTRVQHSSSPSWEGGGNRGQGCCKDAQAAAVLQGLCCHNSQPTAWSAHAACPPRATGTAGATLVTQEATAPAHVWEPRQHPWMQRMHLFSQA